MADRRRARAGGSRSNAIRFAHPFFDRGTSAHSAAVARRAGPRMRDFVKQFLHKVPKPHGNPRFDLAEVVGTAASQEFEAAGKISFHLGGDTGVGDDSPQTDVALAMGKDFDLAQPVKCPAFFCILGDVIYGPNKRQVYREQFYVPYKHYPGKIISIAGNHDGDVYASTDPKPLTAWLENFCNPTAASHTAVEIFRVMPKLPGVYWQMDSPFVQIIGLYSNKLENPGHISGPKVGMHQRKWLVQALKQIRNERNHGQRKALVVATHHPPYSSGGHGGSSEMLHDIDGACTEAGVFPDVFLSAHAHSYQRYIRKMTVNGEAWEVPFLVIGCSGHGRQRVPESDFSPDDGVDYVAHHKGYGYATAEVTAQQFELSFYGVDGQHKERTDRFTLDLQTHKVTTS